MENLLHQVTVSDLKRGDLGRAIKSVGSPVRVVIWTDNPKYEGCLMIKNIAQFDVPVNSPESIRRWTLAQVDQTDKISIEQGC